jgi:hypothetical protein
MNCSTVARAIHRVFAEGFSLQFFMSLRSYKSPCFLRHLLEFDLPLTLGPIVDFSDSQQHFCKQHSRDLEIFLKDIAFGCGYPALLPPWWVLGSLVAGY